MQENIKLGCLGLGRLGYQHAKNIATRIQNASLYAICDIDEQRTLEVSEELQVPHRYTDFAEMLALDDLDAVVIVSPSDYHVEHIKMALEAGKHVFCEKPLSTSIDVCKDAEEIVEAHPDQHFMLGFMRRYDPSYQEAKERIDAGEIGRPVLFRAYSQDPISGIEGALRFSPTSGGVFFDMAVHDIDLARWLLGVEPVLVHSIGGNYVEPSFAEFNDYDNASCLMQFSDDTMGFFFAGRTAPHGYNVETEIIGTEGILRIASVPQRNHVEILDKYGVRRECSQDFLERFDQAYVNEVQIFVRGLIDGEDVGPNVYDGTASAVIAEACTQSIRKGEMIELRDLGI